MPLLDSCLNRNLISWFISPTQTLRRLAQVATEIVGGELDESNLSLCEMDPEAYSFWKIFENLYFVMCVFSLSLSLSLLSE